MIHNIKVDIIYYLMASDFEMEFNLCGCCRMRLLADKASDKKALVTDMKRAVSRSRVTIVCGPLFSENGLVEITARAVNRQLVSVNKEAFNINANDELNIIEGAFPLVTKDGIFGGLIIESGPQSIILLTESKSVRKEIMQNLIHSYIEELSLTPEQRQISHMSSEEKEETNEEQNILDGSHTQETEEENIENQKEQICEDIDIYSSSAAFDNTDDIEIEQVPEETEKSAEETEEQKEEIPESEIPDSNGADGMDFVFFDDDYFSEEETSQLETQEDTSGFYIEPKRISFKTANEYASNYVPSKKDEMFISELEETYDKIKKDKKINIWLVIILATLGILLLFVVYYLLILPFVSGEDFGTYYNELFGMIE